MSVMLSEEDVRLAGFLTVFVMMLTAQQPFPPGVKAGAWPEN